MTDKNVKEDGLLRVSRSTNPAKLAGAIATVVQKNIPCELVTVGAGPCNQAMKAIAIANSFLGSSGISLSVQPCFLTLDLSKEKQRDGQDGKSEVTALKFKVIVEK